MGICVSMKGLRNEDYAKSQNSALRPQYSALFFAYDKRCGAESKGLPIAILKTCGGHQFHDFLRRQEIPNGLRKKIIGLPVP